MPHRDGQGREGDVGAGAPGPGRRPGGDRAAVVLVEDPGDPRLADYQALRTRGDRTPGYFVAESLHVVRRVVGTSDGVRSLLLTPGAAEALADVVAAVDAPVYVAPRAVLEQVVGFDLHRGALAAVSRRSPPPLDEVLRGARLVAALEGLNDHENLGVLFRNAAALGVDAVVLDDRCADPLYRRTVRVSIGHVCTVPWTRYRRLADLGAAGFELIALTPGGDQPVDRFSWPERCAVLVGAEGPGLSDAALAVADASVRIPMRSGVDSLNVAAAAAIAFHHASRARLE